MNKWLFPLDLDVLGPTEDKMSFKNIDIHTDVEIPIQRHVGAFGVKRKKHIHNGVDLYCEPHESVYAVEDGIVVDCRQWTGADAGSPWWNDTYAIIVEGESGAIAYGEITVKPFLTKGCKIAKGEEIGSVLTVLKKDKGRPRTMLHLQMYKHGNLCAGGWDTNDPKPSTLIDPTLYLLDAEQKSEWVKIRVGTVV